MWSKYNVKFLKRTSSAKALRFMEWLGFLVNGSDQPVKMTIVTKTSTTILKIIAFQFFISFLTQR